MINEIEAILTELAGKPVKFNILATIKCLNPKSCYDADVEWSEVESRLEDLAATTKFLLDLTLENYLSELRVLRKEVLQKLDIASLINIEEQSDNTEVLSEKNLARSAPEDLISYNDYGQGFIQSAIDLFEIFSNLKTELEQIKNKYDF